MGAMYRLKAYFGMVPAEEMADYADEPFDRYAEPRRERTVREYAEERWDDRHAYEDEIEPARRDRQERAERRDRYDRPDDDREHRPGRSAAADRPSGRPGMPSGSGSGPTSVRGALAMDPDSGLHEPLRAVPTTAAHVPEQRDRAGSTSSALSRITTLQPRSYRDARTIGERYRSGVPVIMNLTELDAAEAKRLVDFAAGLVFALHGGFDKVTNRVFLLTPADVEVSADDARMIAQRSVSSARQDGERGFRVE